MPVLAVAAAVLVVAGAAAAGLQGGEGGEEGDGADPQVVVMAAETALAASSARLEMRMTMRGAMGSIDVTMTGAFDADRQLMEIVGDGPMGVSTHRIQAGSTFYLRVGRNLGTDPGGWTRVDGSGTLADERVTAAFEDEDPTELLEMLREVGDVEYLGADRLDGHDVQHYRATGVSSPDGEAFEDGAVGDVEVWIDRQLGLPVRVASEMSFEMQGQGTVHMTMEIDYRDWNEPVDITIPPDDAVVDHRTASSSEELAEILGSLTVDGFQGR